MAVSTTIVVVTVAEKIGDSHILVAVGTVVLGLGFGSITLVAVVTAHDGSGGSPNSIRNVGGSAKQTGIGEPSFGKNNTTCCYASMKR